MRSFDLAAFTLGKAHLLNQVKLNRVCEIENTNCFSLYKTKAKQPVTSHS